MRALSLAILAVATALLAPSARAQEVPKDVKGVYLLTDYPAVTVRPGTTSTISLRLQNYGQAPDRLALSVNGVPSGWTATLLGGGQPVAAAMPATNAGVSLELRLDVPKNAAVGTQTLTVVDVVNALLRGTGSTTVAASGGGGGGGGTTTGGGGGGGGGSGGGGGGRTP